MPIIQKITPKQVALLDAKFAMMNIYRDRDKLDWLYEHGINVEKLEDIPKDKMDYILKELE